MRIHTLQVYGTVLTIELCNQGQKLKDRWNRLITKHAPADEIYEAMRDYFFHRNGVYGKDGTLAITPCEHCHAKYKAPLQLTTVHLEVFEAVNPI